MADELVTQLSFNIDASPLESIEGITEQLNKTFKDTENKVAGIDVKQNKTFKNTKKNIETARNSVGGLSDGLKNTQTTLNGLSDGINGANTNIKKLTINIKNYNKQVKQSEETTKSFRKGLTDLALSKLSFDGLKAGMNLYASFSDQMVRVKGLTRANEEDYQKLTAAAKKYGAQTSFSTSQVGEAFVELAQKGYDTNKIIATTPGILGLAETSSLGLAETTKILTGAMNAYGAKAEESLKYADIIAKAQATASVTTQSLGDAFSYSATRAATLGYSINQLSSWIMALGDAQIEGSSAGTGINSAFSDIINKSDKIKRLGVNVYDPITKKLRSLEDISLDLSKATAKMTEERKNATLAEIFGEQSIRVMSVMMQGGAEKSKLYQKALQDSAGTSSEFSKIMNSDMGGAFRSLGSATEGLVIALIETLKPAIMGITNVLTGVINGLNWAIDLVNKSDWLQSLTAGLMGAALAGKILTGVFWALGISNPIGWIVIAIGGAIAAITLLEKKFQVFTKMGNWIKDLFGFGDSEESTNKKDNKELSKAKSLNIPKHARGTSFAPGGITLVGEEGPELVQMPRGAKVFTADKTKQILSMSKIDSQINNDFSKNFNYSSIKNNNKVDNFYNNGNENYLYTTNNRNSVNESYLYNTDNRNSIDKFYSTKNSNTEEINQFKYEISKNSSTYKNDLGNKEEKNINIEGDKIEIHFNGEINNFEDIKEQLEKWFDKRERKKNENLRFALGGTTL